MERKKYNKITTSVKGNLVCDDIDAVTVLLRTRLLNVKAEKPFGCTISVLWLSDQEFEDLAAEDLNT